MERGDPGLHKYYDRCRAWTAHCVLQLLIGDGLGAHGDGGDGELHSADKGSPGAGDEGGDGIVDGRGGEADAGAQARGSLRRIAAASECTCALL